MNISKIKIGARWLLLSAFATVTSLASVAFATNPYANSYEVNTTRNSGGRFDYRPGELIVKFKTDVAKPTKLKAVRGKVQTTAAVQSLNGLLEKYGAKEAEDLMPMTGAQVTPAKKRLRAFNGQEVGDANLSSLYLVRLDPAKVTDIDAVIREFTEQEDVEYAEPNYLAYICSKGDSSDYTTDPLYSQQWGPSAIGLDKLWTKPIINNKRPIIAILDTGVDITHPDLAANIWTNQYEADGSEGRDDDANGFSDDIHGWDFVNNTGNLRDNNGHGTHCAGIAAAVGGNGIGITGANPNAYIMPITVIQSDGFGDVSTIIRGVDYAIANGADVFSMSFTISSGSSMALHDALAKAYHKSVLIAAAGNDGYDLSQTLPPGTRFPAAYNFVIGVMASMENGELAPFTMTDNNGPIISHPWDEIADADYNYELAAPGTNILSTYPGGGYKILNGTSMSCPLVAGAISRLYQCKNFENQEILFGDLIHSMPKGFSTPIDFEAAYNINNDNRSPELYYVSHRLDDSKGDGDFRPDAGETIDIYVALRNSWGYAKNIKLNLALAENEDPEIVEFIESVADFGHSLSGYARNESSNPLRFKISDKCTDTRRIRFVLTATCDDCTNPMREEFTLIVENGIELGGMITEDQTLYPDKYYILTNNLYIPDGVTLTLMPGTKLYIHDVCGIKVADNGGLIAKGTPENRIYFLPVGEQRQAALYLEGKSEIEYCVFDNLSIGEMKTNEHFTKNIMQYCGAQGGLGTIKGSYNLFTRVTGNELCNLGGNSSFSTFVNNNISSSNISSYYENCNVFNYPSYRYLASAGAGLTKATIYPGSAREDIYRNWFRDIRNPEVISGVFGEISRKDLLKSPRPEAPGCVWKILVDGFDAQDEHEKIPDLGVGRHKFDIYFSKKMNRDFTPEVSMGVRDPYTQTSIQEGGHWSSAATGGISGNFLNVQWKSIPEYMRLISSGSRTILQSALSGSDPLGKITITGEILNREISFEIELVNDADGKTINKSKEYLVKGETSQFKIRDYRGYGLSEYEPLYSVPWESSNESVVKIDNDGLATAIGPGVAYISKGGYKAEVKVFESELPEGVYFLRDKFIMYYYGGEIDVTEILKYRLPDVCDVYTVYHTIKGRDNYDGLNNIRVSGAYDLENFPCPLEDTRFRINIQNAGAMSSGFVAEAGVGKVTLKWENPEENFDDMLGYNMYRYTLDENNVVGDTIRINEKLLDKEEFIDYDIVPGTTYCYYYKVLRTSLEENAPSKVVAATPRAAGKGDANASGDVDVADVVTEVNYMVGRDPKPFIFDAADVNDDNDVDILDVVGTVNIIMKPQTASIAALEERSAVYTIEDGILYINSSVELAGVQIELNGERGVTEIRSLEALRGMESTGDWMSDKAYRFIAFSLSGKTLSSGRQALLSIGRCEVEDVILVDVNGNRVAALRGNNASGISAIVGQQINLPYPNPFTDVLNVPVTIATQGNHNVEISLTNLVGTTLCTKSCSLEYGEHTITLPTANLSNGFYIVTLNVNGKKVQSVKAIKK